MKEIQIEQTVTTKTIKYLSNSGNLFDNEKDCIYDDNIFFIDNYIYDENSLKNADYNITMDNWKDVIYVIVNNSSLMSINNKYNLLQDDYGDYIDESGNFSIEEVKKVISNIALRKSDYDYDNVIYKSLLQSSYIGYIVYNKTDQAFNNDFIQEVEFFFEYISKIITIEDILDDFDEYFKNNFFKYMISYAIKANSIKLIDVIYTNFKYTNFDTIKEVVFGGYDTYYDLVTSIIIIDKDVKITNSFRVELVKYLINNDKYNEPLYYTSFGKNVYIDENDILTILEDNKNIYYFEEDIINLRNALKSDKLKRLINTDNGLSYSDFYIDKDVKKVLSILTRVKNGHKYKLTIDDISNRYFDIEIPFFKHKEKYLLLERNDKVVERINLDLIEDDNIEMIIQELIKYVNGDKFNIKFKNEILDEIGDLEKKLKELRSKL